MVQTESRWAHSPLITIGGEAVGPAAHVAAGVASHRRRLASEPVAAHPALEFERRSAGPGLWARRTRPLTICERKRLALGALLLAGVVCALGVCLCRKARCQRVA